VCMCGGGGVYFWAGCGGEGGWGGVGVGGGLGVCGLGLYVMVGVCVLGLWCGMYLSWLIVVLGFVVNCACCVGKRV